MALKEEDVKYFAEKYGATYTDLMSFGGECYGIAVLWGGTGVLQYNRSKLEDLGIKPPKEYYLEGKFTQLYYEAYQIGGVNNSGNGLSGTNPYVLNKPVQAYPYMASFMMYTDANGDVIDTCPMLAWKEGEKTSSSLNYVYMLIPTGCADYDQAIKMMDFIMECGLEDMDSLSYSDVYSYEGLTGCTEWTKNFLEARYAKRDELDAATKALPEYDAEWITTINKHLSENVYHMQLVANGIDWDPWNSSKNSVLWDAPSATSIAQMDPVTQAQCDAFNLLYLGE